MKNSFWVTGLMIWASILIFSCDRKLQEDTTVVGLPKDTTVVSLPKDTTKLVDYFSLKAGAKYKYNYSDRYSYPTEGSEKYGECTWEFISSSVVKQTFNGTFISKRNSKSDTTQIRNEISTLSFDVSGNTVTFNHFLPYWGKASLTFVTSFWSDGSDICQKPNFRSVVCLKKNVGITRLDNSIAGNHLGSVSYSLIEGPIY